MEERRKYWHPAEWYLLPVLVVYTTVSFFWTFFSAFGGFTFCASGAEFGTVTAQVKSTASKTSRIVLIVLVANDRPWSYPFPSSTGSDQAT